MNMTNTSVIEDLEPRLAPAGIVTVTINSAGLLTITGDPNGNIFEITEATPNSGIWKISDSTINNPTTFVLNGQPAQPSITFPAQQSLKVTLNGGDDQMHVNGIQINGRVDVFGNDGVDTIDFSACVVNGVTTIDSGTGGDQVSVMGTYNGAIIKSGAGNDTVNVLGGIQAKGVTVDLGTDANTFNLDGPSLSIFGNLSVTAPGSTGVHQVFNVFTDAGFIAGNASFKTTIGGTTFNMGDDALDSNRITGNLTLTTAGGDDIFSFTHDVSVGGALNIVAGAGTNEVFSNNLGSLVAGSFSFTGGMNTDDVNLSSGGTVIIGGNVMLTLGDGSNGAAFGGTSAAIIGGGLTFTGGAGNDDLFLNGSFVNVHGALNFKGGNGFNGAFFSATSGNLSSVNFTGGTGGDLLDLGGVGTTGLAIQGNVVTNMGTGSSILSTQNVLIYGNLLHANAAALGGNDFTDIKNTKILGSATINSTGTANSFLNFNDSSVRSAFTLNSGAGDDILSLDTLGGTSSGSLFGGPVMINMGAGNDTFSAGANPLSLNALNSFGSTLKIDGGAGNDTANFKTGFGNSFFVPPTNPFVETVN